MDILTKEQRRRNMQAIKNHNTSIELLLRKKLWSSGVRYRINTKIYGHPDIVIAKYKLAIFCDGDFWHGKEYNNRIKTNSTYWNEKIKRNKERDLEVTITLRDQGWTVLRFWEDEIKTNLQSCIDEILLHIKRTKA